MGVRNPGRLRLLFKKLPTMNFTFGIITGGASNHRESLSENDISNRIQDIIGSIEFQNIPQYEIIIVGGNNNYRKFKNVNHISFDETQKEKWITRKKNLIVKNAIYDNLVIMHDYLKLEENWYKGFLQFGDDWDVCMNVINNIKGGRWIDWLSNHGKYHTLIPYDTKDENMYVSGAYWVAKKSFMEQFPLNEDLAWGEGEDIEWSLRWKKEGVYKMNPNSCVRCCKEGKQYSVIFSTRSEAEKAFNTSDLKEILKWYNPALGPMFKPWEKEIIPTAGF